MRALLQASMLLAPALAVALVVRKVEAHRHVADQSAAFIELALPLPREDHWTEVLSLRLDVLPSEQVCGLGNVTIDGQALPQALDGDTSSGKGPITTVRETVVVASWSFHCIRVNGHPESQFLKFVVDSVDGKAMKGVGFSTLFKQAGSTEFIHVETDLNLLDELFATPNSEGLQPVRYGAHAPPALSVDDELDELRWLRAQMRELKYLIRAKERAVAKHASDHFEGGVQHCDSLKCVAEAVFYKVWIAAHHLFDNTPGHNEQHGRHDSDGYQFGHFPECKKLHGKHGRPGNHACEPLKHRKHGTHTVPPHWKKHHPKPLPVCRYPPPQNHLPHHKPPHKAPPPPPDRRLPGHGDTPPHHGPPEHDDAPPPNPHDGFTDDGRMPPPSAERPPPSPSDGSTERGDHLSPPLGPENDLLRDGKIPPPVFESKVSFSLVGGEPTPQGPPSHHGPRSHRNGLGRAFHATKFFVVGILISLIFTALHRRTCNPMRRADRKARREERRRRRAFRHAVYKHPVTRFFARISRNDDLGYDEYEEKRETLLHDAEEGMSSTMTEEITELRNAASVVSEIITESSRQFLLQPFPTYARTSEEPPMTRAYDIGSQVGEGEELPAYEENDGSEISSTVADGFRYTPGSSAYSPMGSQVGSASDVLGPDTKQ